MIGICSRSRSCPAQAAPCASDGGASRIGPAGSRSASGSLTRSASPSSREVMSRSRSSSDIIFIRIRLRTRAKSARSLKGFDRKSSAPASSPRMRSSGVSSAVTMITGMCEVSSLDFSAAQTANPSMPGIITSSITMSGCSPRASSSACSPFSATTTS